MTDQTSREMTFEEEAEFYEKEARAEFAKETGSGDCTTVNNILRRGMRIIRKARAEIAHGVTVQKWISVKDRLPEGFEFIIVANWDENHTPRVVKRKALMAREYWGFVTGFYAHGQQVTHWMPMPQPPKGD